MCGRLVLRLMVVNELSEKTPEKITFGCQKNQKGGTLPGTEVDD